MTNISPFRSKLERQMDNEPHFNVFAICLNCKHKWIATIHVMTSIFKLECPKCKAFDSFGSIIPEDFTDAVASLDLSEVGGPYFYERLEHLTENLDEDPL